MLSDARRAPAVELVGVVCTRPSKTCSVRNERTAGPNGGRVTGSKRAPSSLRSTSGASAICGAQLETYRQGLASPAPRNTVMPRKPM
jgi:hypothetical protein